MAPLNVALRLAACHRVEVRAVGYADISNEWNEWLTRIQEEEQQEEVDRAAAASPKSRTVSAAGRDWVGLDEHGVKGGGA
jgi:hypothetical protein